MNPDASQFDELKILIDALLDDSINSAQTQRLNELLAQDDEAVQFYIQYSWMDSGLARHVAEPSARFDSADFTLKNSAEKEVMENIMVSAAPRHQATWRSQTDSGNNYHRRRWRTIYGVTSLAGLAIAIVSAMWIMTGPFGNDNLLRKASQHASIEPNQSDTTRPAPNEFKEIQTANVHRQTLADGSVLIARGGTKLNADRPRHVVLESGDIYLIVAKSETPFVVETADGKILATGTRFTVSKSTDTGVNTFAAVAQGTIVMKTDAGATDLAAGQQGNLIAGKKPNRQPAPRLSHLVNWAKDALAQDKLLVEPAHKENGLIAIDPYGQQARLTLRQYNVDVHIEDGVARTTIDQTFFNHNPWNTEGTFYFPLPPDASVSRLAMYVNGKLNEGGMVTRERGQQIYTEILYQRRDPALLEMMEGNMFKMRIFPLEGRQEKRIFLSYTQTLDELYGTARYRFPMDHTQDAANQLSIRVRVKNGAADFDPKSSTHALNASTESDDLVLEYTAEKIKPDQDFLLSLLPKRRQVDSPQRTSETNRHIDDVTMEMETRRVTEDPTNASPDAQQDVKNRPAISQFAVCKKDDQNYLSAQIYPELESAHQPQPRQWIVLNDISASRSSIELAAQQYILERLIEEADDDDSISLIDLNTDAALISDQPVNIRSNDAGKLVHHPVERLIGATNIAAGLQAAEKLIHQHNLDNPHVLYLGDGIATDGEKSVTELPRRIPEAATFIGIGVGKSIDALFLQEAADQTGGVFTTINPNEDINWRVFDLLASLNTPRLTNVQVTLLDKNNQPMEAIAYPSSRGIAAGEKLSVVAMCNASLPTRIRFQGQLGEKLITLDLPLDDAKPNSEYIPRLWAKRHIDELLKSDMSSQDEIVKLSKDFYVVTPYTSLIVLEDDAMYREYDVERGRKDHWALYDAPQEIEVIKEPVDWNRWGWYGNFASEDGKIETTTKPKTIQEIVDNIQLRINAPFYYWDTPPQNSRTQLYQMCNPNFAEGADPSRLMTLWFLLAAGDRDSILDWRKSVGTTDGNLHVTTAESDSEVGQFDNGIVGRFITAPILKRPAIKGLLRSNLFLDAKFSQVDGTFESILAPSIGGSRLPRLGLSRQLADLPMLEDEKLRSLSLFRRYRKRLLVPMMLASPDSNRLAETGLAANLVPTVQQAMQTRWSRIERDIQNFNHQYGYYNNWDGWGGWPGSGRNSIDLRDGNRNWNWSGGLDEILGGLDDSGPIDISGFQSPLEILSEIELGTENLEFDESWLAVLPMGMDGPVVGNNMRDFDIGGSSLGFSVAAGLRIDDGRRLINGRFDSISLNGGFIPVTSEPKPPSAFLAISSAPLQQLPGTTSVLAADYLKNRLTQLNDHPTDEKASAEIKAIKVALSRVGQTATRLESTGEFWGWNGWNYQPRPRTIQPPQTQVFQGYNWSFDLTRYADGLYSTSADMLDEIIKQYGSPKPRGSISTQAREAIETARSNFQPVAIRFDEASEPDNVANDENIEGQMANVLLAGPHDQFAFTHRNEMYLEERFICDGKNIVQFYDELGLAARRDASEIRLADLRQYVPHLVEHVESMIRVFDVELIDQNDEVFVLKLSVPAASQERKPTGDEDDSSEDTSGFRRKPTTMDFHLLLKVDRRGRLLAREMVADGETVLKLDFNYQEDRVSMRWSAKRVEDDAGQSTSDIESEIVDQINESADVELGKMSFMATPFEPTDKTFAVDVDQHVVIDMPLKKPSFYREQMEQLATNEPTADDENPAGNPADNNQPNEKLEFDSQDLNRAIYLLRHQALAELQEFHWRRWGQSNSVVYQLINHSIELQQQQNLKPQIGELLLLGSATSSGHTDTNYFGDFTNNPIALYFDNRYQLHSLKPDFFDQRGLIGHLANYHVAVHKHGENSANAFHATFSNSPLQLALAEQQGAAGLLELAQDGRWTDVALLMAAGRLENIEQKHELADLFWKRCQGPFRPRFTDQVVNILREVDSEKLTAFLTKQFEEIIGLDSTAGILNFAETVSNWQETELADQAFMVAARRLSLDGSIQNPPLLNRFAFGSALWAGGRHEHAWAVFDAVLSELEEKEIAASPALLAASARLAQQAGQHQRAVELEEQALFAEQPYLPDAINLQAFRQRYQWLWNQYQTAINEIGHNDPQRESQLKALLSRATATWDRWQEVDGQNESLYAMMANLLTSAGLESESWKYLSSTIDLKPRDANSYFSLGQWYRNQNDLKTALRWYAEAPQWDTANPQWIFHYATALKELGRKRDANAEFQKIVDGKWAPGLENWVDRAKAEIE